MGQAKARALHAVAAATNGEPVTIELGERSARRLAALRHAAEGAQAVAQSAQALVVRYQEAVAGVLEANGLETGEGTQVEHDADTGVLVVRPPPSPGPAIQADG